MGAEYEYFTAALEGESDPPTITRTALLRPPAQKSVRFKPNEYIFGIHRHPLHI